MDKKKFLNQLVSFGPPISLAGIITNILTVAWVVFAAIAVVCFLAAGILFLTSMGDPKKVQTARAAFLWGLAGVAVGIIAYSAILLVGNLIGV